MTVLYWCREAQNKRGMISEAEREAQEAEAARRRDEQRQRELRGALESQQRTVDSAVTDTQQRVGGESAVHVTCYHGLLKREFLYLQHQSTSNAVCLLITSCFLDTRSSVFSTHVPVSLSVSNETASADVNCGSISVDVSPDCDPCGRKLVSM